MKMKKLLASCLAIVLAIGVTGCGGSNGGDKTTVNVAIGGDAVFLDPAIVDDSITNNILCQTTDGLYKLDKDGNLIPNLATDLPEVSEDGLTYTIKMKEGTKWSNGEPVKASDFIYAWKRAVSMGSDDAYYSPFISNYVKGAKDSASMEELDKTFGAKAVDDNTIEITLAQKASYFPKLLSCAVFYPLNEKYVTAQKEPLKSNWTLNEDVPYNGAFHATSVKLKSEIVLEKNTEYYAADEVKLEGINFKVMPDFDSETNGFISGEIDFATSVNNDTVEADQSLLDKCYYIDPFVCNYYVLVNAGDECTNEVLKDKEIRKAISLAINRDNILEVLNFGKNATELSGLVPV
ncbi:peptide ABC transporter substrate-binding protein, partial [Intestinibacter sp.]